MKRKKPRKRKGKEKRHFSRLQKVKKKREGGREGGTVVASVLVGGKKSEKKVLEGKEKSVSQEKHKRPPGKSP